MTVSRWLSRIDRDTSIELDALDDHVQAEAKQPTYTQARTWDSDDDDIHPQQNGLQATNNFKPHHMPKYLQNLNTDIAPNNYTHAPTPNSSRQDNTPTNKPQAFHNCWPAAGECHLCGFGPKQLVGVVCIGRTKVCDSCGMTGHMIKACKKGSGLDVVNQTTLVDTPAPDSKEETPQQIKSAAHTTNPPRNQNKCMDPGGEVNPPGKGIHNAKQQDNINCNTAMVADDKSTSTTNTKATFFIS